MKSALSNVVSLTQTFLSVKNKPKKVEGKSYDTYLVGKSFKLSFKNSLRFNRHQSKFLPNIRGYPGEFQHVQKHLPKRFSLHFILNR